MEALGFMWYFDQGLSTAEVAVWLKVQRPVQFTPERISLETTNGKRFVGKPALLARAPHSMGREYVRVVS